MNNVPTYLDPGSLGGWVRVAQEAMYQHQLSGALPEGRLHLKPTGAHEGAWLHYVKGLQGIWGIDIDGGMGPEFRQTYREVVGIDLLAPRHAPGAATLVFSPRATGHPLWFKNHPGTPAQPTMVEFHRLCERTWGGDGSNITEAGYQAMDRVIKYSLEKKGRIILISTGYEHSELREWQSRWCHTLDLSWDDETSGLPIEIEFNQDHVTYDAWLALAGCLDQHITVVCSREHQQTMQR